MVIGRGASRDLVWSKIAESNESRDTLQRERSFSITSIEMDNKDSMKLKEGIP
jgi:hypothetical protein